MDQESIAVRLNPFPTPTWLADIGGFNTTKIIPALFTIVFIVWSIYTIIAVYHWFRYSHRSWLTVPVLALHIFVSLTLLLTAISGLR